jgi:two-component system, response regulator PdtaR
MSGARVDILIIEDEFLLGLLVAQALSDAGHRVLGPASCRAEALAFAAECIPQLALVDIELRDGESGIELAEELKLGNVPCVFATGEPEKARQHRALAMGLVRKPCSPATLIEAARYFGALLGGERPARVPRGLELFGPDALPTSHGRLDAGDAALVPIQAGLPSGRPEALFRGRRSHSPIDPEMPISLKP